MTAPQIPAAVTGGEPVTAAGSTPRSFALEMPAGLRLVNANRRYAHPAIRGREIAVLRKAAWVTAHNALRAGTIVPLSRVRICVEYQPPLTSRARDAGNWAPSGKAFIDGLRDAKVLIDDDSRYLIEEAYRIGEPFPKGRVVLFITEVAP